MEAGRELDAAVAEKVMGWTDLHTENTYTDLWYGTPLVMPAGTGPVDRGRNIAQLPYYSSAIAAAWQVVEQMHAKGYTYTLTHVDKPHAEFHLLNQEYWVWCNGATMPLAICLAALKTVEINVLRVN